MQYEQSTSTTGRPIITRRKHNSTTNYVKIIIIYILNYTFFIKITYFIGVLHIQIYPYLNNKN
jgi:hypothetical protein